VALPVLSVSIGQVAAGHTWTCQYPRTAKQGDATVEVAFPIFNDVVGFCLEGSKKMFEIVLTNVFDAKVIDAKVEPNGA
jgi:hypothetical protein